MSTQIQLPPSIGIDISTFLHFQSPDGQLQSVLLQSLDANFELERLFLTQPVANETFNYEQKQAFKKELTFLGLLLKVNDAATYKHSLRVKKLTHLFLRVLNLPPDNAMIIEAAALLHDLGKIAIDAALLHKPALLTVEEFEEVKKHPALGAIILQQFKTTRRVIPLVYYHHERWDGNGYPAGLRGEAIPLGARIVAITDAFDAITSHRPYQPARTPAQALLELRACAATQFDPFLVRQFCKSYE